MRNHLRTIAKATSIHRERDPSWKAEALNPFKLRDRFEFPAGAASTIAKVPETKKPPTAFAVGGEGQ